jgi:nucleotide-binding universal stress UspA family protein
MNVLLTTDLSEAGLAAIEGAIACGVAEFDRITLLHVIDLDLYTAGGSIPGIIEYAHSELEQRADELREGWFEVDVRVEQGTVVETIESVAEEIDADLIVMTNVGKGAVAGRLLGSTAERVASSGRRMVLLERVGRRGEKWCRLNGGSPFDTLVLGVDEPSTAGELVSQLVGLPGLSRIVLVNVSGGEHDRSVAEAALNEAIRQWPDVVPFEASAVIGKPVEMLLQEAARVDASAIAVAPLAHGVVRRGVLGSVSHGLLRKADRAVVLVPWGR